MTIKELKTLLANRTGVAFMLPDGSAVPSHFHITEVGKVTKDFIDCGGTVRQTVAANLQLWEASDYDHRLSAQKLADIIQLSQQKLDLADTLEIEVEYQGTTIGKYGLAGTTTDFQLTAMHTDCLALDSCGVPDIPVVGTVVKAASQCCSPGGGGC